MAGLTTPPGQPYEVILDGGYFCDLLFLGISHLPAPGTEVFADEFALAGGWTFRTARALARLGVRTGWPADFGNDIFSRYVRDEAIAAGIDPGLFRDHDRPIRHVTAAVGLPTDRAFISFMDDIDVPSTGPIVEANRPDWICVPGLSYESRFGDLATSAFRVGSRIFMDCQDVPVTLETKGVAAAISAVDVFSPNELEAKRLAGRGELHEAIAMLADLGPTIVVKRGAFGALVSDAGRISEVPGFEVEPKATTGAGDCFNAGFIYGLLHGSDALEATRLANIVGALSTTAADGSRLPDESELLDIAARWAG